MERGRSAMLRSLSVKADKRWSYPGTAKLGRWPGGGVAEPRVWKAFSSALHGDADERGYSYSAPANQDPQETRHEATLRCVSLQEQQKLHYEDSSQPTNPTTTQTSPRQTNRSREPFPSQSDYVQQNLHMSRLIYQHSHAECGMDQLLLRNVRKYQHDSQSQPEVLYAVWHHLKGSETRGQKKKELFSTSLAAFPWQLFTK